MLRQGRAAVRGRHKGESRYGGGQPKPQGRCPAFPAGGCHRRRRASPPARQSTGGRRPGGCLPGPSGPMDPPPAGRESRGVAPDLNRLPVSPAGDMRPGGHPLRLSGCPWHDRAGAGESRCVRKKTVRSRGRCPRSRRCAGSDPPRGAPPAHSARARGPPECPGRFRPAGPCACGSPARRGRWHCPARNG